MKLSQALAFVTLLTIGHMSFAQAQEKASCNNLADTRARIVEFFKDIVQLKKWAPEGYAINDQSIDLLPNDDNPTENKIDGMARVYAMHYHVDKNNWAIVYFGCDLAKNELVKFDAYIDIHETIVTDDTNLRENDVLNKYKWMQFFRRSRMK